jgi:hypothetical protein
MADNCPRRYDISMLRDFLDHLLCELRLAKAGFSAERNGAVGELSKLANVYRQKYNVPGMLEQFVLENDLAAGADLEAAEAIFAAIFADLRGAEIGRLEELQGLFDEALRCCARDDISSRNFSATELMSESQTNS